MNFRSAKSDNNAESRRTTLRSSVPLYSSLLQVMPRTSEQGRSKHKTLSTIFGRPIRTFHLQPPTSRGHHDHESAEAAAPPSGRNQASGYQLPHLVSHLLITTLHQPLVTIHIINRIVRIIRISSRYITQHILGYTGRQPKYLMEVGKKVKVEEVKEEGTKAEEMKPDPVKKEVSEDANMEVAAAPSTPILPELDTKHEIPDPPMLEEKQWTAVQDKASDTVQNYQRLLLRVQTGRNFNRELVKLHTTWRKANQEMEIMFGLYGR